MIEICEHDSIGKVGDGKILVQLIYEVFLSILQHLETNLVAFKKKGKPFVLTAVINQNKFMRSDEFMSKDEFNNIVQVHRCRHPSMLTSRLAMLSEVDIHGKRVKEDALFDENFRKMLRT